MVGCPVSVGELLAVGKDTTFGIQSSDWKQTIQHTTQSYKDHAPTWNKLQF
jgi:hypothetical protein